MNIQEFGQSIKQKYPQYNNVDDAELGKKVLEKYPQYSDRVTVENPNATHGVVDAFKKGFQNAGESIKQSGEELAATLETPATSPAGTFAKFAKTATGIATGIARPLIAEPVSTLFRAGGEIVQNATGYDINEGTSDLIKDTVSGVSATAKTANDLIKQGFGVDIAKQAEDIWKNKIMNNPESKLAGSSLGDIAELLSYAAGYKGAKNTAMATKEVGRAVVDSGVGGVKSTADSVSSLFKPVIEKGKSLADNLNPKLNNEALKEGFNAKNEVIKNVDLDNLPPQKKRIVDMARTQGFDDKDIQFFVSMTDKDRSTASQMLELADRANSDIRVQDRPIDIAGRTMVNKLKTVESELGRAGKAVDTEAKGLKGKIIDSTPLVEKTIEILDNMDVFKYTPKIRSKLENVINNISDGMNDAYDMHVFKKSIDELVDYGVGGEGLKGNAERMLKSLRTTADDILDKGFDRYNKANTEYKFAKEIKDFAQDLFGKKNNVTKNGSHIRAGQVLRSAFGNNTTRARVYELAQRLDDFEKIIKGKVGGNALDQALFAERLEKTGLFDTQAITGFSGQIENAIKKTQGIAEGIRNPVKGGLNLMATGIEKLQNISPEQKRRVLEALIK